MLLVIDDENWFRVFENQANWHIKIQIVHNILWQFFAHTLMTVVINKYVNSISIGFSAVELSIADDENRFRVFEESNQVV